MAGPRGPRSWSNSVCRHARQQSKTDQQISFRNRAWHYLAMLADLIGNLDRQVGDREAVLMLSVTSLALLSAATSLPELIDASISWVT